jgi:hypothetical protein
MNPILLMRLWGSHMWGKINNVIKKFKKERSMKVETIEIKEFQEIVDELTEVLSQLGARFVVDEFFPM